MVVSVKFHTRIKEEGMREEKERRETDTQTGKERENMDLGQRETQFKGSC